MKTIAIMPIKLNNERLPGKNTKLLGTKPLLQYQLEALQQAAMVDSVNVFCSSEDVVPYLPAGVNFIKRTEYLDLPTSNFTQIFENFMAAHDADIYVYAPATAFATVSGASPTPSITIVRTGPLTPSKLLSFLSELVILFLQNIKHLY